MAQNLRIGELASATNTKVETIRYYEQIGLLPCPKRTTGNYRAYTLDHLKRLSFIRRSRELGFNIEQVRDLLSLADQKQLPCDRVDGLTREHLASVDAKIADLRRLRAELASIISRCSCGTIAECRIIDALGPRPDKMVQREAAVALNGRSTDSNRPIVSKRAR